MAPFGYGTPKILLTLLLLTTVDSKRSKTHVKHKHTVNDHLRPYATDPPTSWEKTWATDDVDKSLEEHGEVTKLLDMSGNIKERFAFAATSTDTSVSVVCSPFSAMMPLGILLLGAGNHKTERELLHAVGLGVKSKVHDHFKKLRNKIKNLENITTYLASRIYVNIEKKLKSGFKEKVENTFGSCIDSIDMKNEVETANAINYWVKKQTKNKIDRIISASDISPYLSLVIVDAIYFNARWRHKFKGSNRETFYGRKGRIEIKLMYRMGDYKYGACKALGAEAIEIPYKGDAVMLVLLPNKRDGLDSLLQQLKEAPDLINSIKMKTSYVDIRLPKFKIETELDLKVLYEKVGLREIFSPATGLENLVHKETVIIDKAVQKAIIEVDELGTVAAAASVVGGVGAAMPPPNIVYFRADHPFLFFIIAHEQQLFAGTFVG